MRGKVSFKQDLCKGCELCTTVCPVKIVKMSDGLNAKGYHPSIVAEEDMHKCIACAFCAMICPDCAIEVEKI